MITDLKCKCYTVTYLKSNYKDINVRCKDYTVTDVTCKDYALGESLT